MSDELVSIIAHGIAEAQGDAYAEYASEFDGYARAAVDALKKHNAGLSIDGVNVWGESDAIKVVMAWQHSHSTIDDVRTNLQHWREECGKVHAHKRHLLDVLQYIADSGEVTTGDGHAAAVALARKTLSRYAQ